MSTTKHTPAPWVFDNGRQVWKEAEPAWKSARICKIENGYGLVNQIPESEMDANLHLIAAAPDMLAALRRMWAFASELVEAHGMDGDDTMTDAQHHEWQEAGADASAAIAKAEGV